MEHIGRRFSSNPLKMTLIQKRIIKEDGVFKELVMTETAKTTLTNANAVEAIIKNTLTANNISYTSDAIDDIISALIDDNLIA